MKIPGRQHWLLQRTDRRLRRSDPHLAAMLAIFARLYIGETIVSREQAASPAARLWRRLNSRAAIVACAAAAMTGRAGRAARRAVRAWVTIPRRVVRLTQALLSSPPVAQPPAR